jgi:hypothetical protein
VLGSGAAGLVVAIALAVSALLLHRRAGSAAPTR